MMNYEKPLVLLLAGGVGSRLNLLVQTRANLLGLLREIDAAGGPAIARAELVVGELFRIEVLRFLHVVRFQEVRQWIPGGP